MSRLESKRLLSNDYSSAEKQRDIFLSQQFEKKTQYHYMYHLCHPRTHLTAIALLFISIVVVIFSIAFVCNWAQVPNVHIPAKQGSQFGSWLMPLSLCLFFVVHMLAVLGPLHTCLFVGLTMLCSFGMNELLEIQFHNRPDITFLKNVPEAHVNKVTFLISQTFVLYLTYCMADTIIFGKISKFRIEESVGRRQLKPQLLFLPIFAGLLAFCIDELLFGPMLFNGGIVSYQFQNEGNINSAYFGMSAWYLIVAAFCRIAILLVYIFIELLIDWLLVLIAQKFIFYDPDFIQFVPKLIYSFFRPAYSVYRIDIEWVTTVATVGRFIFVYVFLWIVWLCLGIMFSTIVDPFVLRVIGCIVFLGVGIASVAATLTMEKKNDEQQPSIII
jgi:hypothetical protein